MMVFVVFMILVHVSQHALAVVVQAYEGEESALLPYQFYHHFSMLPEDATVLWSRYDLKPRIIHLLNDEGDDLKKQNKHYSGRTSMKSDALDSGDFDLALRKPQMSDSSNYTCAIWTGLEELRLTEIQLQVKDNQVVMKVQAGAESVRLPCKTSSGLPEDTRVEWTRFAPQRMVVHVYQNMSVDLTTQNPSYCDRTEMNKDLLTTGDLSLTLKYPTDRDSGTYICTFYMKGDTMKKKVVLHHVSPDRFPTWAIILFTILSVALIISGCLLVHFRENIMKDIKTVEVGSEVEAVRLPCKENRTHVLQDITVVWTDNHNDIVCVYEKGSKAPHKAHQACRNRTEMNTDRMCNGDFSLFLKYPTDKDNYTYTCTVYSKDNKTLLRKQVELKVKVCQVEVEEGADSVLLPFRTTPDLPQDVKVKWIYYKHDIPKKLHLYVNGSVEQDQDYINRTEMNEDSLGTGDLSLTLKNPKDLDSGKYRCRVFKNEDVVARKTLLLKVKDRTQQKAERVDLRTRRTSTDPTPLMTDHSV